MQLNWQGSCRTQLPAWHLIAKPNCQEELGQAVGNQLQSTGIEIIDSINNGLQLDRFTCRFLHNYRNTSKLFFLQYFEAYDSDIRFDIQIKYQGKLISTFLLLRVNYIFTQLIRNIGRSVTNHYKRRVKRNDRLRRSAILEFSSWISGMYCLETDSSSQKTWRLVTLENTPRLVNEVVIEIYTTTLSRRATPSLRIALTTAGESVITLRMAKNVIRNVSSYRWNNRPEIGDTSRRRIISATRKKIATLSPAPRSRRVKFLRAQIREKNRRVKSN